MLRSVRLGWSFRNFILLVGFVLCVFVWWFPSVLFWFVIFVSRFSFRNFPDGLGYYGVVFPLLPRLVSSFRYLFCCCFCAFVYKISIFSKNGVFVSSPTLYHFWIPCGFRHPHVMLCHFRFVFMEFLRSIHFFIITKRNSSLTPWYCRLIPSLFAVKLMLSSFASLISNYNTLQGC